LFVQANPIAGDHQVNVRLLAVLALFFLILTLSLLYLKQRRRAQAGGAGSMV
jgi:preprotein translocase subunit SecG